MAKSFCVRHKKIFRFLLAMTCFGGFSYQSLEFFNLYWTYPTVVDIQDISPTWVDIPAFTFCNAIGYNYRTICDYKNAKGINVGACLPSGINRYVGDAICTQHKAVCVNDSKVPSDFQTVTYTKFVSQAVITPEDHDRLRQPLEEYLNCTIEFGGIVSLCNLTNVMGSFYTKEEMPQYCYTIYSLWGNPDGKREKIQKGATMRLHFSLNTTLRYYTEKEIKDPKTLFQPKHNLPTSPSVQIAVHSPYFLPSPYLEGYNYIGGKAYEIRLMMKEKHLLPHPYQTNCTDYMKMWKERGGEAPIDQMSVIQECRINKSYEALGCVPVKLDYPHRYNICSACEKNCSSDGTHQCLSLADSYQQPCDSIDYTAIREDKTISVFKEIKTKFLRQKEGTRIRIKEYDCKDSKVWRPECGTIDIDVSFDRFEIANLTYKPKFETLEIFSVVGGYMGMWLGISLMSVYDFAGVFFTFVRGQLMKRKRRVKNKVLPPESKFDMYTDTYEHQMKLMTKDKPLYW